MMIPCKCKINRAHHATHSAIAIQSQNLSLYTQNLFLIGYLFTTLNLSVTRMNCKGKRLVSDENNVVMRLTGSLSVLMIFSIFPFLSDFILVNVLLLNCLELH